MKGRRIRNFEHLLRLMEQKRSVYYPNWQRTSPAAMVVHMPAILLHGMIKRGLWEWKAKRPKPARFQPLAVTLAPGLTKKGRKP